MSDEQREPRQGDTVYVQWPDRGLSGIYRRVPGGKAKLYVRDEDWRTAVYIGEQAKVKVRFCASDELHRREMIALALASTELGGAQTDDPAYYLSSGIVDAVEEALDAEKAGRLTACRAALAGAQEEIKRLRQSSPLLLNRQPSPEELAELERRFAEAMNGGPTHVVTVGPRAGDRVQDGGQWGTLVRCETCGGDGLLHKPDAPDQAEQAEEPSTKVFPEEPSGASTVEAPAITKLLHRVGEDPTKRAYVPTTPNGSGVLTADILHRAVDKIRNGHRASDFIDRRQPEADGWPRMVVLCGSMRFWNEMQDAAVTESLAGNMVLAPFVNMKKPDPRWAAEADAERIKTDLDRLHFEKINASDEVLVVCPGGYIGESTRREIEHATAVGKPVRFYSPEPCRTCGTTTGVHDGSVHDVMTVYRAEVEDLKRDGV